jgi:hypothetical protein
MEIDLGKGSMMTGWFVELRDGFGLATFIP